MEEEKNESTTELEKQLEVMKDIAARLADWLEARKDPFTGIPLFAVKRVLGYDLDSPNTNHIVINHASIRPITLSVFPHSIRDHGRCRKLCAWDPDGNVLVCTMVDKDGVSNRRTGLFTNERCLQYIVAVIAATQGGPAIPTDAEDIFIPIDEKDEKPQEGSPVEKKVEVKGSQLVNGGIYKAKPDRKEPEKKAVRPKDLMSEMAENIVEWVNNYKPPDERIHTALGLKNDEGRTDRVTINTLGAKDTSVPPKVEITLRVHSKKITVDGPGNPILCYWIAGHEKDTVGCEMINEAGYTVQVKFNKDVFYHYLRAALNPDEWELKISRGCVAIPDSDEWESFEIEDEDTSSRGVMRDAAFELIKWMLGFKAGDGVSRVAIPKIEDGGKLTHVAIHPMGVSVEYDRAGKPKDSALVVNPKVELLLNVNDTSITVEGSGNPVLCYWRPRGAWCTVRNSRGHAETLVFSKELFLNFLSDALNPEREIETDNGQIIIPEEARKPFNLSALRESLNEALGVEDQQEPEEPKESEDEYIKCFTGDDRVELIIKLADNEDASGYHPKDVAWAEISADLVLQLRRLSLRLSQISEQVQLEVSVEKRSIISCLSRMSGE